MTEERKSPEPEEPVEDLSVADDESEDVKGGATSNIQQTKDDALKGIAQNIRG